MIGGVILSILSKYWKIIIMVILTAACVFFWNSNTRLRQDNTRMGANQESLLSEVRHYKLKDSSNVANGIALQLTVAELQQSSDRQMVQLKELLHQMDIKLKNIQSVSTAQTVTTNDINTFFRDSVLIDKRTIHYLDTITPFYDIRIRHYPWNDSVVMKIIYKDKMTQTVYWEKSGFAFWRKKQLRQVIHFANPDTEIQYSQYIEIWKNKKNQILK